jgi:hypothetical protein
MKLKLVIAISALAAMMPAFAQAKQGETPPNAPTSTMAQVQKVIQIISGNKTKLHTVSVSTGKAQNEQKTSGLPRKPTCRHSERALRSASKRGR